MGEIQAEPLGRKEGRHLFGLDPSGYDAGRPDYPPWVYDRLADHRGLVPGARVVEMGTLSVAVSVAGIVAILVEHLRLDRQLGGTINPQNQRMTQAMLVITVMLVALAAINAVLITWATVLDSRHASALARALGATPRQVSAALSAAQLLSVLPGSLLGVPLGIALIEAVTKSSDAYKVAPAWSLILVILGTWLVMSVLTAIPACLGTRRSTAQILQGELG